MDLRIRKTSQLNGEIIPPGSKSYSHRAFILAGLADGISTLKNPLVSGDVLVTLQILEKLGVKFQQHQEDIFKVYGKQQFQTKFDQPIDCKNSGTSIRIFSALSLLIEGGLTFKGEFLQKNRPLLPLLEALTNLGAQYRLTDEELYIHRTSQECKNLQIRGDISSQFITALLITGPLLKCKKKEQILIKTTTPLVSYPYIKITLNLLNAFGVNIEEKQYKEGLLEYKLKLNQKLKPQVYEIPSDFSSAAFIIAASVLSPTKSQVIIKNLYFKDPQGDKRIIDILKKMGAKIKVNDHKNQLICYGNIKKNKLRGIEVDCKEIPDLFPILSVIGAYAQGKMVLYNAEGLRLKESDRISIMARELQKMGVEIEEYQDKLIIYHCNTLKGAKIDHAQDHRIAMACTIAALYASSESEIHNIEIVKDSYPRFIEDLNKLGANIKIVS
jgi:3-phosphoshikimate 1-carboxyvinyltransferase